MGRRHVRSHRVFRQESEPALFGPSLTEVVAEDHEVWSLRRLVDEVFAEGIRLGCTDHGGVPYDPARLLAVVMYGFMNGIHSTRGLENACRYDVRFWVLTGQNTPDHNTIHRFLSGLRERLPEMMRLVASAARERGLLAMRVVAVDGTKVAAGVSQWGKLLDHTLAGDDAPTKQRDRRGGYLHGFNAQIAVDAESGMIVGEALLTDANDYHAMPAVVQSIQETTSELPAIIVADKGYDSGQTHTVLASQGVVGVVIPQARGPLLWRTDEHGNPVCPAGFIPEPKGGYHSKGRYWKGLVVQQCKSCSMRQECGVTRRKTIYVPEGTNVADRIRNDERFEHEEIRKLAKTRGPTVELPFARLKCRYRLGRLSYPSRAKSHAEFRMFCLAENLRRLLRAFFALLLSLWRGFPSPNSHSSRQKLPLLLSRPSP